MYYLSGDTIIVMIMIMIMMMIMNLGNLLVNNLPSVT